MKVFDILSEGPNDPHIFKAVFLAGGPGSGKSFVSKKLLSGTGLRVVNSDDIYEYMMTKQGMKLDPETIFSPAGQSTREKAKAITDRKQASHIGARLGLIIDGTGKDVAKYAKTKKMLEDLGYDTMMLFVNTSLDVAQERNLLRLRSLEAKAVEKMWNAVQQNIMAFQQLFGAANFYVVDNSGGLEDPARQENFNRVQTAISKFINTPSKHREARAWLAAQKPTATNTNEAAQPAREITQLDLQKLEMYVDKVFAKVGIDVEFSRHFLDRVNDERNIRQITLPELAVMFRDEYTRWGKKIAQLGPDAEAVMKDMRSDINLPFALNWDPRNQELDLVAKTVMRKKNFKTPDREFPVESRSFQPSMTPMQDLLAEYQMFTSFGQMGLSDYAKSPDSAEKLKEVIRRLSEDNKKFQNLSKETIEKNKNKILTHIHDVMNYAIAHFREHLKPEHFDAKKPQINTLLKKYNSVAATTTESREPNQLRGQDRAKTTKPSTAGSQKHPFKGKLVGNS